MFEFLLIAFFSDQNQFTLHPNTYTENKQEINIHPLPQKKEKTIAPKMLEETQVAFLAFDTGSGRTLWQKDIDRPQHIASISKLMTALIIIENHSLNAIVQVAPEATITIGAQMDLYAHERVTIQTLLEAIIIPSANDAALALAIYDAGTEEEFVVKMNQKAQELGLTSAKFINASGLDQEDADGNIIGNQMSARDVLKLSRIFMQNKFLSETAKKDVFEGSSVEGKFFHTKKTTNQLLNNSQNINGLKTGYTELAGQCFVARGTGPDNNEILTVILGSSDRFGETEKVIDWVYNGFNWK